MSNLLAVMIMAAGESRRFGGCKQLASLGEKTVLQRIVDVANSRFENHVYVVTGRFHDEINAQIRSAQCLYNPEWTEGLGKSIAYGVSCLAKDYDGILLILGDQVAIESRHLDIIADSYDSKRIICANYYDKNGVPALFPRIHYESLKNLDGDKGAQALLNQQNVDVKSIKMTEAAIDIDTRDSLAWFNRQNANSCWSNP